VNVIGNTSDRNRIAFKILKNAGLVGPDSLSDIRGQQWTPAFG
jgi:hypothetical protein